MAAFVAMCERPKYGPLPARLFSAFRKLSSALAFQTESLGAAPAGNPAEQKRRHAASALECHSVACASGDARPNGHSDVVCGGAKTPRGRFERLVAVTGVQNFTWHCLRHTFASRLVMAGVDIRTVAELLGHKTLAMTMRYAHLAPDHQLAAVEKLDTTATRTATSAEPVLGYMQ